LTKKSYGASIKFKVDETLNIKVVKLYKLYQTVIKTLMEQGAYLNHIRPEFLMSFSELGFFLRTDQIENAHPVT